MISTVWCVLMLVLFVGVFDVLVCSVGFCLEWCAWCLGFGFAFGVWCLLLDCCVVVCSY